MKRFHRPLFALLFSLLLIGSQQAALAHMVGHLGGQAETAVHQEESGHGAALSLSHTCTTCIAYAALDGPPAAPQLPFFAAVTSSRYSATPVVPFQARTVPIRRARGPPQHSPA